MTKPKYGITLETARGVLRKEAQGHTFSDPTIVRKSHEVVRYWDLQKSKRS